MSPLAIGSETKLPAGVLYKLEDGVAVWIECTAGSIWITQSVLPRDIVLAAGESAAITAPRDAIIGAINGPATVWTDAGWDLSMAA